MDERLVMPETRFEVIDGEVVYVSPADQPHGSRHSKLSALLEAYAAEGYDAASDMLTRTSEKGDLAPDGSIYAARPDPETGGRQLEELAFEIVSSESLGAAGKKAAALVARGVRRVFAIDVARRRALEWSQKTQAWQILPARGKLDDAALALPLPVHDLVVAAKSDDAVARALLAKQNPVLVEALAKARVHARCEGKAEAILLILSARGMELRPDARHTIQRTRDPATLDRWLTTAVACHSAAEFLACMSASPRRRAASRTKRPGRRKR